VIDFGISTELDGRQLNAGLIDYKEGFGARAVNYDFYEMPVSRDG
jgi:lipid II:glycine glycyltransferase (peptidoglycan interpeptide bridge formation enzyme)